MKLEVNLSKKYFFILLGTILVLAGAIYGYAYGGNSPSVMGHSGWEIEVDNEFCNRITGQDCQPVNGGGGSGGTNANVPNCIQGQILIFSEGVWSCYGSALSCEDYGGTSLSSGCLFDIPGTYNYRFPLGISSATVTVIGGGGSGGTQDVGHWHNFGGAGGGATVKTFLDTENVFNHYIIEVGAGGDSTGSAWHYGRRGESGEYSSFGSFLKSTGGDGGYFYGDPPCSNGCDDSYNAKPGSGMGGDINCDGVIGTYATYQNAIGGSGECSGGAGGAGGAGGGASSWGGDGNSQTYGAGSKGTGTLDGGDGAVIIEW